MYTKHLLSALLLATASLPLMAQQEAPQDTTIYWHKHLLELKEQKGNLEVRVYKTDSTGTKQPSQYLFRGVYGNGRTEEQGTREHIRLPRPEILFSPLRYNSRKKRSKNEISSLGASIGYIFLTGDGSTGLRQTRSIRYQLQLLEYHRALSKRLTLSTGIHMQFNSIHFNDDYAYREENGTTRLVHHTVPEEIRTSRLHITYITLPVTLRIRPWEKSLTQWEFAFGGELKLRTASSSKVWKGDYRTPELLGKDLNLNPIVVDLRAQIKCSSVGVYATYSLLPLFHGSGLPSTQMYSLGVSLGI